MYVNLGMHIEDSKLHFFFFAIIVSIIAITASSKRKILWS